MSMITKHWLELLTPLSAYQEVYRIFGLQPPPGQPRSLIPLFEQSAPEDPTWFDVEEMLDRLELAWPQLEQLGIKRSQTATWIETQHDEDVGELHLEPLTAMRLGEQGTKLCWVCYQADWDQQPLPPSMTGIPVGIRDVEGDVDPLAGEGSCQVWVSLDDDTLWQASFTTFQHMRWQWAAHAAPVQVQAAWQPSMVVVPDLQAETLSQAVADLLRRQTFEEVFSCVAGSADPVSQQPHLSLDILIDEQAPSILGQLATRLATEPRSRPHLWQVEIPSSQAELASRTQQWIQEIHAMVGPLLAAGIHRNDMVLNWNLPYQERCHVEMQTDLMVNLAETGLSLQLVGKAGSSSYHRCLDE